MYKQLSQKNLKKFVKDKINTIGECSSIKKYHNDDYELFTYLFSRHSDYPEKFNNLKDVYIRYNPVFKKNLEVMILKENGDIDNVSVLNNCIKGKPKEKLTIAMRNAIIPQILEFRNNNELICNLCFSIINCEIDHYEPKFCDLKTNFLNIYNGKIPNEFCPNDFNSSIFLEKDSKFKDEWYKYHKKNAKLRVLCKKCNSIY